MVAMAIVGEAKEMMKGFERQACEERRKRGGRVTVERDEEGREERGVERLGAGLESPTTMTPHQGLRDCPLLFPFAPAENIIPPYVLVILKEMMCIDVCTE